MDANVNQSQNIKIPTPLHAQLKALAAKRSVTMVEVIHGVVRDAIAAGELPDEVPGLKVRLELDLDAEDHGPFVIINTAKGDMPRMTRDAAKCVARYLAEIEPGQGASCCRSDNNGAWVVSNVGTGVKLTGQAPDSDALIDATFTVAFARAFARQVLQVAEQAVPYAD